ncbi:uncharacterized protein METZ01_LOCUS407070, partial [marine metagenome]
NDQAHDRIPEDCQKLSRQCWFRDAPKRAGRFPDDLDQRAGQAGLVRDVAGEGEKDRLYQRGGDREGVRVHGQRGVDDFRLAVESIEKGHVTVWFPRRFGVGAGVCVLFSAREAGHQAELDRLPSGSGVKDQGGDRVRAALDQRLPDRLFPEPGAGGHVRGRAAHHWFFGDRSKIRDPAGCHRRSAEHHPVPRRGVKHHSGVHPVDDSVRAGRRLAQADSRLGLVCCRAGHGGAFHLAQDHRRPRGAAPADDHCRRDGGHHPAGGHHGRRAGHSVDRGAA